MNIQLKPTVILAVMMCSAVQSVAIQADSNTEDYRKVPPPPGPYRSMSIQASQQQDMMPQVQSPDYQRPVPAYPAPAFHPVPVAPQANTQPPQANTDLQAGVQEKPVQQRYNNMPPQSGYNPWYQWHPQYPQGALNRQVQAPYNGQGQQAYPGNNPHPRRVPAGAGYSWSGQARYTRHAAPRYWYPPAGYQQPPGYGPTAGYYQPGMQQPLVNAEQTNRNRNSQGSNAQDGSVNSRPPRFPDARGPVFGPGYNPYANYPQQR